jgi:hypothetical protein
MTILLHPISACFGYFSTLGSETPGDLPSIAFPGGIENLESLISIVSPNIVSDSISSACSDLDFSPMEVLEDRCGEWVVRAVVGIVTIRATARCERQRLGNIHGVSMFVDMRQALN